MIDFSEDFNQEGIKVYLYFRLREKSLCFSFVVINRM